MPNLKCLILTLCEDIAFEYFQLIFENGGCLNLTRLQLDAHGVSFTDGEKWESLLTVYCPKLKKFNLYGTIYCSNQQLIDTNLLKTIFETQFWRERNIEMICEYDQKWKRFELMVKTVSIHLSFLLCLKESKVYKKYLVSNS